MYRNLLLKYALCTRADGAHLVGRCVLYSSFSRPFDSMNRNGKWMKLEATWGNLLDRSQAMWNKKKWVILKILMAKQQRKLSCLWRRMLMEFRKWFELKKNHLSMMKSNLSRHLLSLKVLPTLKALHNIDLDVDNQLLCSNGQTEAGQMYDKMRRLFETF